jgi:hypothetical protein
LARELEQLRAVNDDLRGSAEIWIHLYEAQLSRTKHLEHRHGETACTCGSQRCEP